MTSPHKVEFAAGISATGAITAWLAENLVWIQWGSSIAAIIACIYAILVHRRNLKK